MQTMPIKRGNNSAGNIMLRGWNNLFYLKEHRTQILSIGALLLVLLAFGSIDYSSERYVGYDLHTYIRMAESSPALDMSINTPHRFRVLAPWLAGLVPLSVPVAFKTLTMVCLLWACICLYFLFRHMAYSSRLSLALLFMLVLNPYTIGFVSWNYFQLHDTLGFALLVSILLAGMKKRFVLTTILLILGALTREFCMLAVPVLCCHSFRLKDRAFLVKIAFASLPAVVSYFLLRWFLTRDNVEIFSMAFRWKANLGPESLLRIFVNVWAPLSFLPLVFWRESMAFIKQNYEWLLLLILVYISTFFAGDKERLLLPGVTAFFVLVGWLLKDMPGRLLYGILLIFAFIPGYIHNQIGVINWPARNMTLYVRVGALVCLTVFVMVYQYREKHKN
ncbi:MAG: hypothetical protein HQK83_02160 [Fibrobacteria bacterium]|nr:hypothetical protein [Fibrobacteria bacterium]